MRTGLFPENDMKAAASLQTTDYHSRDEQVLLASWGREDMTTDSLRVSRPFDEVRLQSSPCSSDLITTSPVSLAAAGWARYTGDDHVVQLFWKNWNIFSRLKYECCTVRSNGIRITVEIQENLSVPAIMVHRTLSC
jgi:hypothetical protein